MNRLLVIAVCCLLSCKVQAASRAELDIGGSWNLRLDRLAQGVAGEWWEENFEQHLHLPGSLTAQGFGDEPGPDTPWVATVNPQAKRSPRFGRFLVEGNFKFPFWLQPDKYYRGAAWYQRQIHIPKDWKGKRVVLYLERPHWETSLWLDGHLVGEQDSLSTPHEYELGLVEPGEHRITLRVDNSCQRIDVGRNAHSITDHTQGNWNGVVGEMKLVATDLVWIQHVRVDPDVGRNQARVRVELGNRSGEPFRGRLRLRTGTDMAGNRAGVVAEVACRFQGESHELEVVLPLRESMQLWDEFHPALYELRVEMLAGAAVTDAVQTRFGMREMATKGSQFTINGRPLFLRGTLECAVFPKTGHPPTEVAEWRRIFCICKDHGLNHMRFHSWCPPKAAFIAADELGFYLQVEMGSWAMFGATVGDGRPLDDWLYKEGERITRAYGNHPSFVLMAYGNEPTGKHHQQWLTEWCRHWKEKDPRMLHAAAAGWPLLEQSDYHCTHKGVRIQEWGAGLNSIINAKPPQTRFDFSEFLNKYSDKPTLSHEIGQWCVYPNFDEIPKYDGLLKPRNFEIFREFLDAAKMGDQARDFLMASGKLQALCYKHDIEASLRTRGFGGFQLLGLNDFPGQGTALVGILDPFWDSKDYVTAEEHRRYCAPTVPLARMDQMVWTSGEVFKADVEIAHFGPHDLQGAVTHWSLTSEDGIKVGRGAFGARELVTGRNTEVGSIRVPLDSLNKATKLVLEVAVEGTNAMNHWNLWCYPNPAEPLKLEGLHLTRQLDDAAVSQLQKGGKVLWMVPPERVKTDVALGFSSIFWNTTWTNQQPPHTLGILCDPDHLALADFPTDYHSSWQWWDLMSKAATLEMDDLPDELRPIVQVVPDWFAPKRLGLVFEAKVGPGCLLVTSMDLETDSEQRPVARQMLSSLKKYMASDAFDPAHEVKINQLRALVNP